jgi:hypothetical protein
MQLESDNRRLHAGCRSAETRSPEQSGQIGQKRQGIGRQIGLNGSKWIMKKNGDFVEVI